MSSAVLTTLLAGISYDPEIRGVLVVVVAAGILCGSVYLLLATNLGARLGFQVALAGLFGWLMLLSLFWWIYGVGAIGTLPSWRVEEINVGNLAEAQFEDARELVPENLPSVEQILADNPDIAAQFDPGKTITLSEIAALTDLPDDVAQELEDLPGEWSVLPQSLIGDAQAAADAVLISGEGGLQFAANTDYVLVDGFTQGGKEHRASDSTVDRVANFFKQLWPTSPPHYVVVQVQTSQLATTPPGNAPLSPTPDPDEPVVSVVMVRDLGTRRLPPAVLTFMWGGLFALTCSLLHQRDKRGQALNSATTGS